MTIPDERAIGMSAHEYAAIHIMAAIIQADGIAYAETGANEHARLAVLNAEALLAVTRPQAEAEAEAEAIIAAERAEKKEARQAWKEAVTMCVQEKVRVDPALKRVSDLEADNAALTARVKELEDKRIEDRFSVVDEMEKVEALENQLAAKDVERETIMQAITDPENQPSQFGTVTIEYMKRQIAAVMKTLEVKS